MTRRSSSLAARNDARAAGPEFDAPDPHALRPADAGRRLAGATSIGSRGRVLVSTLAGGGGVDTMTSFVVDCLATGGYEPVLAHYRPYSIDPQLSVPIHHLIGKRIGRVIETDAAGRPHHGIGAWLPELEFTDYWANRYWRELIEDCKYHVAVSGNVLAATPYMQLGIPYLCWVATPWEDDRRDRVKTFPLLRRMLDSCVNAHMLRHMERKVLRRGRMLALSEYTARRLGEISGASIDAIMGMPIDVETFTPARECVVPGRIGFAGRFTDPRKNILLLLEAGLLLRQSGLTPEVVLLGDVPDEALQKTISRFETLGVPIRTTKRLDKQALASELQTFDVFVVPSHQEGLCIAALEAMACGCPTVSTRCGGPEEFVLDGRTGLLVESTPQAVSAAVASIVCDRAARDRMGEAALDLVLSRYSQERAREVFWNEFEATFNLRNRVT